MTREIGLFVNCSTRGFTSIPPDIPANTAYLSLDGNFLHSIPSNAFKSLGNLIWLDLSDSHIYSLESGAFNNLFHLNFLNLKNNNLSENNGSYGEDVFSQLTDILEWLDISGNLRNIARMKMSYLSKSLQVLKLACISKLSSLEPLDLTSLISLEHLDLSHNKFRTIPKTTKLMLENLDKRSRLSLNLSGNPLSCTCKDLQFTEWLTVTKICIIDKDQYTCTYKDGTLVKMSDKLFYNLESDCNDNTWIIANFTSIVTYYLLVTLATVCCRYQYYFRYFFHNFHVHQGRLRHFISKRRMRQERLDTSLARKEGYHYDAFISCTREGAKWIKRHFIPRFENDEFGLKFCIAQTDFVVGKTIIDNIIDSIHQSRKTILIVDKTFINSKWCQEELLLSHHVSDRM